MIKTHILITGSHRSGSTWTAKMISAHPDVNYIAEPFNPGFNYPGNPIRRWFTYLDPEGEYPEIKRYIRARSQLTLAGLISDLRFLFRKGYFGAYFRMQSRRLFLPCQLIKDPIAIFSAEWLAKTFNMKVIVLIRHPAAFVASLILKSWTFDFGELLVQNTLIEQHLYPFRDEIEYAAKNHLSILEQGILLWNIFYYRIYKYKKLHPDWYFIKHEELSLAPGEKFRELFAYIGIPWDEEVHRMIRKTSDSKNINSFEASRNDEIIRNSADNIKIWKNRLTVDEINKIRIGTYTCWNLFYDESDWV